MRRRGRFEAGQITVMMSPGADTPGSNGTVAMLIAALPPRIRVREFSWLSSFLGGYDILHVHWPEHLLGHRRRPTAVLRSLAFHALLLLLRVRGVPRVWTVHNHEPHEPSVWPAQLAFRHWRHAVTSRVYMSSAAAGALRPTDRVIPRGDYRPMVGGEHPQPSAHATQILAFGLVRPYKGFDVLLDAARALGKPRPGILIAGSPDRRIA